VEALPRATALRWSSACIQAVWQTGSGEAGSQVGAPRPGAAEVQRPALELLAKTQNATFDKK